MKKLTTEIFISRSIGVQKRLYGYELAVYTKGADRITIVCPDHGVFTPTAAAHLAGYGCPHCAGNVKRTTEVYIDEANKVHNSYYDYSDTDYVNSGADVVINCPVHGSFNMIANHHLAGYGCKECFPTEHKLKYTTEEYIEKASEVNKHRYDYTETIYTGSHNLVEVMCSDHGLFKITAKKHLQGQGCAKCGGVYRPTQEEAIQAANEKHGWRYGYEDAIYVNNKTKMEIHCSIHGSFFQAPGNHITMGQGCPQCFHEENNIAERVNSKKPATLYYVKIYVNNDTYYKIGVTGSNVDERFSGDKSRGVIVAPLQTWYFDIGSDAYKFEASILRVYKEFKIKGKPLRTGNTEIFYRDVLWLDK